MPKKRPAGLLDPLKLKLRAEEMAKAVETARKLLGTAGHQSLPTGAELTPEHPFSLAFGHERARQLLDPELAPHRVKAAKRRAKVLELSLAGTSVRKIAASIGLSPYYVVQIRSSLRAEGKLPPV